MRTLPHKKHASLVKEEGAVLALFAFILFPLIVLAAMAVDYTVKPILTHNLPMSVMQRPSQVLDMNLRM